MKYGTSFSCLHALLPGRKIFLLDYLYALVLNKGTVIFMNVEVLHLPFEAHLEAL